MILQGTPFLAHMLYMQAEGASAALEASLQAGSPAESEGADGAFSAHTQPAAQQEDPQPSSSNRERAFRQTPLDDSLPGPSDSQQQHDRNLGMEGRDDSHNSSSPASGGEFKPCLLSTAMVSAHVVACAYNLLRFVQASDSSRMCTPLCFMASAVYVSCGCLERLPAHLDQ